jgi:small subunit ribosomal protein S1
MPLPPELDADDTADAPTRRRGRGPPRRARAARPRPEPTTMEELLAEQDSDIKSFKHGDVVEGTVVRIDKDEILVDIGAKSEGVVSNRELYGRHAESQPQLAIGDTVLVYVLQPESQEGHAVLSLRRAGLERKWRAMQEQFEAGVIIEAPSSTTTRAAHRRLRHPRLRADQPDRRLPAPAAERPARATPPRRSPRS